MQAIRFRLYVFLVLLLAVMVVGTAGFVLAERLSLADAAYFTIVTVATVGYGDIHPATSVGKALAVFLIVMGVGTFLGVVANATELMLNRREQQARLEKLNMVIGAFFSEVGTQLLRLFSAASPEAEAVRDNLLVTNEWDHAAFARVRRHLKGLEHDIDLQRLDLDELRDLLVAKRSFLVRLLENPALLEHGPFTDLLWAVFHLTEELDCRDDRTSLPASARHHLAGDIKRAYERLALQWLDYVRHLKDRYPYLFSLAVRTNPFDPNASPIVQ